MAPLPKLPTITAGLPPLPMARPAPNLPPAVGRSAVVHSERPLHDAQSRTGVEYEQLLGQMSSVLRVGEMGQFQARRIGSEQFSAPCATAWEAMQAAPK